MNSLYSNPKSDELDSFYDVVGLDVDSHENTLVGKLPGHEHGAQNRNSNFDPNESAYDGGANFDMRISHYDHAFSMISTLDTAGKTFV